MAADTPDDRVVNRLVLVGPLAAGLAKAKIRRKQAVIILASSDEMISSASPA